MNEKLVFDFLNAKDEQKKLEAFFFLQKAGNITHLKSILQVMKGLEDPYL